MFYDVNFLEISPHGFFFNAKKQGSPQSWMVILPNDISELLRMPGTFSIQKVDFRCMRFLCLIFLGGQNLEKRCFFLVWFDMNQVA